MFIANLNIFSRFSSPINTASIEEIKKNPIPNHVAIIMDGNGRWATQRGLPRIAGHREGVKSLKCVVSLCGLLKIKFLTVYAFSKENWQRPKIEVDSLMNLFVNTLDNEIANLKKNGVRIRLIGSREEVPENVLDKFEEAEKETANNDTVILNIAFNYGARQEIVDTTKQICELCGKSKLNVNDIDESAFSKYLYTHDTPDPDLLIRTSGELRISNFLLWQIAYTELYFTRTFWPAFREKEFLDAIKDYQKRNRRFGRI